MKEKVIVVAICLLAGCLLTSGGYGYWQKDLVIKGNISVTQSEEDPEDLDAVKPLMRGSGTDDPGTDDPGTDDPGTDNPGTEEPGSEEILTETGN